MRDDLVRLSTIGRILRRRWRLLIVLAVIGGLLGTGASFLFSPGYQTTSSVVLQGPREQDELSTETQIAVSSTVLDRAAARLHWGVTGAELGRSVTASVAEGNVIKIHCSAGTAQRARQLADRVAAEYVAYSTKLLGETEDAATQMWQEQRETLQRQIALSNKRITELHASVTGEGVTVDSVQLRTLLEGLRTGLSEAVETLDQAAEESSRSNIVVMGPADPATLAAPTRTQLAGGGALLFPLLALSRYLFAARSDRRLRDESEIASALGTDLLASIDVPDAPIGTRRSRRRTARMVRPWDPPIPPASGDDHGRTIRYRRVLQRLREAPGAPLRLLVLVAEQDMTARRAAARLAAAAAAERGAVSVIVDDAEFAELVRGAVDRSPSGGEVTIQPGSAGSAGARTVLRLAEVSPARPIVPDVEGVSGAFVVTSAGTLTAPDLVGLVAACTDAGHAVVGTLVAHRTGPAEAHDPEPPAVAVPDDVLAGSA